MINLWNWGTLFADKPIFPHLHIVHLCSVGNNATKAGAKLSQKHGFKDLSNLALSLKLMFYSYV